MTARLPDGYFDQMYAEAADPWQLAGRWYERRKYAITMALLPYPRYRHASNRAVRSVCSPSSSPTGATT